MGITRAPLVFPTVTPTWLKNHRISARIITRAANTICTPKWSTSTVLQIVSNSGKLTTAAQNVLTTLIKREPQKLPGLWDLPQFSETNPIMGSILIYSSNMNNPGGS